MRLTAPTLGLWIAKFLVAVALALASVGCAEPVSSVKLSDISQNEYGPPAIERYVEQTGPNTIKNGATYGDADGRWSFTANRDPHMVDLTKGSGLIQGSGVFRAVRVDGLDLGSLFFYGGDDMTIGKMTYTKTKDGPTLTMEGFGGLASVVEKEITAQLALAFGTAWIKLSEAEQAVRIEQVRAQVALGQSIAEAAASVAAKALAPVPIP